MNAIATERAMADLIVQPFDVGRFSYSQPRGSGAIRLPALLRLAVEVVEEAVAFGFAWNAIEAIAQHDFYFTQ